MIDIHLIYELYTKEINTRIKDSLEKQLDYSANVKTLKDLLLANKLIIEKHSGKTLDDILKATSTGFLQELTFPTHAVFYDGREVNTNVVKMYIDKYIHYNRLLQVCKSQIKSCKKELLNFSLYYKIITKTNDKIIEEIVTNNYSFTPSLSFGDLNVIRNHNKRNRVNWGSSLKLKAQLISEGKVPYVKEDAERAAKQGIEYKGVDWLITHPSLDFYLHWHTKWASHKYNPFLKDYKYTPARGTNSIVTRLQKIKNNREVALTLFTRTLNNERI